MGEQTARMRILPGVRRFPFNRTIHLSYSGTSSPIPLEDPTSEFRDSWIS